MHYRNGREAKPGDQVLVVNGPYSKVGFVVNLQTSGSCNALLLTFAAGYEAVTIGECWHMEDVLAVLPSLVAK